MKTKLKLSSKVMTNRSTDATIEGRKVVIDNKNVKWLEIPVSEKDMDVVYVSGDIEDTMLVKNFNTWLADGGRLYTKGSLKYDKVKDDGNGSNGLLFNRRRRSLLEMLICG